MVTFLIQWADVIKTVLSLLTIGGIVIGFLKKLNNISKNLSDIPSMKENLSQTVLDLKELKEDQITSEQLIKALKENLDSHCAKDKMKQKLVLDMARQTLLNEMETAIKEQEVTVSRKAVIGELYNSYVDNGGNGAVHDLWAEFVHLKQK